MSNFIARELDALLRINKIYYNNEDGDNDEDMDDGNFKFIESKVIIARPFEDDANDTSPAAKYIRSDTKEYYYLASNQYTVRTRDNDTDLADILTEEGKELFDKSQSEFEQGEYKDTITKYYRNPSNSGFWSADLSSKYFDENEGLGTLNSWNNVGVTGFSDKQQTFITTSPAIFITDDWCLTRSGSLYKLGNNSSVEELNTEIKEKVMEELEELEELEEEHSEN